MKYIRKYWFLIAVVIVNLLMLVLQPQMELSALTFTGKNFLNFLFMLTPVFICIGLIDVWIEKDTMVKIMGAKAGAKGILISIGIGFVTAVPLYALLPVAGVLLKKGSKISNLLLFLCSSASIRIPLLLFEISSMGWQFTLVRLMLNIAVIFIIAFVIDRSLSEEDKKGIYENAERG